MIKTIKTIFLSNWVHECVRIFNYEYAWSKPCTCILDDVYTSFSIDLKKNYIFMFNQTKMLTIKIKKHVRNLKD